MNENSTFPTLPILLIVTIFLLSTCSNFEPFYVSYKMKYSLANGPNPDFDKNVAKYYKSKHNTIYDLKYDATLANSPDKMQGTIYELWYDGESYLGGGGSGNSNSSPTPYICNYQTIVDAYMQVDSNGVNQPMISVQTFRGSGFFSSGRIEEMVLPSDGVFKELKHTVTSEKEDSIIPVLAYFTTNRFKNESSLISPEEYEAIKELPIQEFIDDYVKKYDGFVVYLRNHEFEKFFNPFSE